MSPLRLPKLHAFTSPLAKLRRRRRSAIHRPLQPLKFRNLVIDPLEARQLLSLNAVTYTDLLVNETYSDSQTTKAGQSIASDHNGDFVVVWQRTDTVSYNGGTVQDTNIYARYFTDEVQRVTLPSGVLNDTISANGKFSLRYGGTTAIQKLTFSAAYKPETDTYGQELINAAFGLSYNGVEGTFVFDESQGAVANAANLQAFLQGLAGNAAANNLATAKVTAVSAREFQVEFNAIDALVQSGSSQPLITWTQTVSTTSGFLPSVAVDRIREPYIVKNIPVVPGNAAMTAANIEYAFKSYGQDTVSVVALSTTVFDITFTGTGAKENHPQMVLAAAYDEFSNPLTVPAGAVKTLKESSPEFRVNPVEVDDPNTMWPDFTDQTEPAVAMDADGDFVITWTSAVPDSTNPGSVSDIFARRFSPAAWQATPDFVQGVRPLGSEFRVNSTTTNAQAQPAVGMNDDGTFAIAWAGTGQDYSFFNSIYAQAYDRDGNRISNEVVIHAPDTQEHFDPYIAVSSTNVVAVTWSSIESIHVNTDGLTLFNGFANLVVIPTGSAAPTFQTKLDSWSKETTAAFDDNGNLLVSWTNENGDADQGGHSSAGIYATELQVYDAQGNVNIQQIRPRTRINSDVNKNHDPTPWAWDQTGSQAMIDADGDILITYSGYGADTDIVAIDGSHHDVDHYIEDNLYQYQLQLVANGISGQILEKDLATYRLMLERQYSSMRGTANDVMYTQMDASAQTTNGVLSTDTVVNNTTDGRNSRYYLGFANVTSGGTLVLRVYDPFSPSSYQDVNISFAVNDKVPDLEKTRQNIDDALSSLNFAGNQYPKPTWEGAVQVRLVDPSEIAARNGENNPNLKTDWSISGGINSTEFVYEITFIGSLHDTPVDMVVYKNNLDGSAVDEVQEMTFAASNVNQTGYFRLLMNGQYTTDIYFDPNHLDTVATAIQNALETLTVQGATPYNGVNVSLSSATSPYLFTLTYTGAAGNTNQPTPVITTSSDPAHLPNLTFATGVKTTIEGHAEQKNPPVGWSHYTYGEMGTVQSEASSAMTPEGDLTTVWMQTEENTNGNATNNNIYYKLYNETTDTAGPLVTDFLLPGGARLSNGGQVTTSLAKIVVSFDEQMMTSGIYSILNAANWALLKDGVEILGGIQSIEFGMNKAFDLGLATVGSNKWEAVITLDGNGASDGTLALSDGHYEIVAKNSLRDKAGNPLRHTGVNVDGSVYARDFDIVVPISDVPSTTETRVNSNITGSQTTNPTSPQTVASDADGDYVVTWTTTGTGVFARLYDVDWQNSNDTRTSTRTPVKELMVSNNVTAAYASVAMDADGDFVVTWSQQDGTDWNVWARRYDATGTALAAAFRVNTYTTDIQRYSTVAMDTEGDFTITWQSQGQDGSGYGVYAQRYSPTGVTVGGVDEVQVISFLNQFTGTFTLQLNGKTTAAITYSGNAFDIASKVQTELNKLGVTVTVTASSYSALNIHFTGTSANTDEPQIVLASATPTSGSTGQIQLYTRADGASAEFRVNDTTTGNQRLPSIAMSYDGSFVITWTSAGQDGDAAYETNVYAKRFFSNSVITGGTANTASVGTVTAPTTTLTGMQLTTCLTTTDDPGNHVVAPGTGYDGVVQVDLWSPVGEWMGGGSGSLLSTGMHILTAAHVATADGVAPLAPSFFTVTFNLPTGNVTYKVSQVFVNPTYMGVPWEGGGDLAVLVLEKPAPSSVDRYDIYRGSDEVGRVFDVVGYGIAGTGSTGAILDFGTKRSGQNRFEVTGGQIGNYNDTLVYDFDDGTKANDTLGNWVGVHDLGLGVSESCIAPGDSGGPAFIDGKIAGVSSYTYSSIAHPSIFGSLGAEVRVSLYADWIDQTLRSGASEFLVNEDTTINQHTAGNQMWSSVAMDAQGSFVISWTSYNEDGVGDGSGATSNGLNGVYARRFDNQGVAASDAFLVNTFCTGNQQHSSVSMDADGDFTVVWESFQDRPLNPSTTTTPDVPNSYGIYGQRYARTALLGKSSFLGSHGEIGSEIAINTTTVGDQRYPGVAMDATGDFVVVWSGNGAVSGQADTQGVFQTRFAKPKDDTGPIVTGVYNLPVATSVDQRETVPEGALFQNDISSFVVTFDEALLTQSGGMNSVTNPNNWALLRNGQTVYGGVAKIVELTSTGSDEYKGKHEFRVYFDGDSATTGYQALSDGTYVLTIRDRVQDLFKNALDGNSDGMVGGNFTRSFSIGVGLVPIPPGPVVPGPTDDDTPVNQNTAGEQNGIAVASNAAGDYVLVWVEYGTLTDTTAQGNIKGQRYNRFGQKQGNEFYVSSYTTGSQITPDVAMDDFGNFVVVWAGNGIGRDKVVEESGIFARVFDSFGVALGDQFRVNDYWNSTQVTPAVAMDSTGNFIVTWAGVGSGDSSGVYAHLFNGLGQSKSADFRVNTTTDNTQGTPDVAADSAGNFTIVWASNAATQDGSSWSVYGRRYSAAGAALSAEFRVNNYTTSAQLDPAVAMDSDGDFVVAYSSQAQDGNNYGVYARRYNKSGAAQGTEFQVNQTTSGVQWQPAVAMDDSGKFVVTWSTFGQDNYDKLGPNDTTPKDYGIYARIFNADGTAYKYDLNGDGTAEATGELRINATTAGNQILPATSMDADGDLVIAWVGPDGSGNGVFERPIVLNPSTYMGGSSSTTSLASSSYKDPRTPTAINAATVGLPTTLVLSGTTGNDVFEFIAAATPDAWVVKINGVLKAIDPNVVAITFDGLAGTDTVRFTGTDGAETVVAKPGAFSISNTSLGFSVSTSNVETFWVDAGLGSDSLQITDSSVADTLTIKPGTVTLTGGYSLTALGFETVAATASTANDTANLYDTAGDDVLTATPTMAQLTGGGYNFQVNKFATVNGFASTGNDKAIFTGSTGNDTFEVVPAWARMFGTGFALRATGFEVVQAAGGGGTDSAKLSGAANTNDTLTAWPQKATMTNTDGGYNWSVNGFATITADGGTAGQDVANLNDSTGNDTFSSSPLKASLTGTGYSLVVSQFEEINATSTGAGTDTATLYDSAGDDHFDALAAFARMYGAGYLIRAKGFDTVTGVATTGRDVAVIEGTTGNDTFTLKKNSTQMTGGGLAKNATAFDEVYLRGYGGVDTATLYDATLATSSQTLASLRTAAVTELAQLSAIQTIQFRKTTDSTYKNDLSNLDQVLAYWP